MGDRPNHKYIRKIPAGRGGFRYIYEELKERFPKVKEETKTVSRSIEMPISNHAQKIIDILRNNNEEAYIVGGAVRDYLMGKSPKDFDIVTSAKPEKIRKLFGIEDSVGAKFAVHLVHGHEVASYRYDDEEAESAKETEINLASSVDEDVRRRDFTVNAMIYDPVSKQVFDFVGGLKDIETNTLRFVGDSEKRIKQDPLRMLRAIRFANSKGLEMDLNTYKAIQKNMGKIKNESPERIRMELMKMLESRDILNGLYLLLTTGFFKHVIPELEKGFDNEQNRHHAESILYHNMMAADAIKVKDPVLKFAALLHDVGKPQTKKFSEETQDYTFHGHEIVSADIAKKIMTRLKFSNEEIERVDEIIRHHMYFFQDDSKDKVIKRFMNLKEFKSILRLRLADRRANLAKQGKSKITYSFKRLLKRIRVIQQTKQPLSVKDLALNGHDLIGLGLKPGPLFGRILNNALELVLENPDKNKKEILLEFAIKITKES